MKKLLTLAALFGAASLTFGQGFVSFANTTTSKVSTNGTPKTTGGGPIGAVAGANNYYFELLVAPTTVTTISASSLAAWTPVALAANLASGGRVDGLNDNSSDSAAVSVAGFSSTQTADFAVVGWSANLGSDYATVVAGFNSGTPTWAGVPYGYFGVSAVAVNIALAANGGPYNAVWGAAASGQIPGMTLQSYIVPEPASMALMGLGAAALMIFRRRK